MKRNPRKNNQAHERFLQFRAPPKNAEKRYHDAATPLQACPLDAGIAGMGEKRRPRRCSTHAHATLIRDPETGRLHLREGQAVTGGKLDDDLEQRICALIADGLLLG